MKPFRPNEPDHVTEQDLFALHLGELAPARTHAVRRLLARDPALASESAAIAAALAAVTAGSGDGSGGGSAMPLDSATVDRNWKAIRPQLRLHPAIPARWHLPAVGGGVAALAAGLALVFYCFHSPARDSARPREANRIADRSRIAPSSVSPMLTVSPSGPADAQASEPGLRAAFRSGVYRPRLQDHDGPIHPIGLAPRTEPDSASESGVPPQRPPLTVLPTPRLTPEPSRVAENQPPPGPSRLTNSITSSSAHLAGEPRHHYSLDIMLGVGGTMIPERDSPASKTVSVTHAIVAIGSLHQQFRPALGYRVTLSYTRPDFNYSSPSSGGRSIDSRIFEAAGTYVVQGPRRKRLTTSADAGAALLAFLPDDGAVLQASYCYRAAGVVGVNVDYAIGKHIGARLGYRAKILKSPDFRYTGGDIPITTPVIVDNEPVLGITYSFGKK